MNQISVVLINVVTIILLTTGTPKVEAPQVEPTICSTETTTKTYMDYQAITYVESDQYNYIQDYMDVSSDGLLRDADGNVGVALGSFYGPIGSKYKVTTSYTTFNAVKVEEKSDDHTVKGCVDANGAMLEFVLDPIAAKKTYPLGITMGDLNYEDKFNGTVMKMEEIR